MAFTVEDGRWQRSRNTKGSKKGQPRTAPGKRVTPSPKEKEQRQMFFDDINDTAHQEQPERETVSLKAEDPSEDGGQETGDGVNEEDSQGQSLELEDKTTTEETNAVPWWKCAQPGHHQSPHNTSVTPTRLQRPKVNSKATSRTRAPDALDDDSDSISEDVEETCEKSNSEGASHKKGSGSDDGVHTSTDDESDVEEEEDSEDSGTTHNNNKPFSEVELLHKLVAAHDTIDRQRAIIKRQRQEIKELKKAHDKKQKK